MTPNALPRGSNAAAQTTAPRPASRRVTDATTRALHWLMALSFTGAFLTADGERWQMVHVTLGYTLGGLLVARTLWGLFGPRQARLSVLARKLQGLPAWLKAVFAIGSVKSLPSALRSGQNPLMALAVSLILLMVVPVTFSGYAVWDEWSGEWLEEVHEFLGNAMLAIVLAHIGLIAILSVLRRKNRALPMLTGRSQGSGPDLAKRNHGPLAVALLASVVAFWVWQWSGAPNSHAIHAADRIEKHHADEDD